MAIAKKPKINRLDIAAKTPEKVVEAFISGAEKSKEPGQQGREKKIPILIRFDPSMLQQVGKAARRRGISRSAWIHFMISRALEQEE
ncbi:MAG: CopG family transcriptional regulator [Candidatus Tectimicrobiota bacterium]